MSIFLDSNIIKVTGFKSSQLVVSASSNSVTLDSGTSDDLFRYIRINGQLRFITEVSESTYTISEEWDNIPAGGDVVDILWNFNDVFTTIADTNVINSLGSIGYILYNKLEIENGGLGDTELNLEFDSCNYQILFGGIFCLGHFVRNNFGNPEKSSQSYLYLNGSGSGYAKDNYKIDGGSPVNDGGTMFFAGVNIVQTSPSRSDFDLRELSTVVLYHCILKGTSGAYHHFDSTSLRMYGFTVVESYSLEMQRTPLENVAVKTVDCYFGLSFYPVDSSIKSAVSIWNWEPINSSIGLKRNNRSALQLIDATVDPEGFTMIGDVSVKFSYTSNDKVTDTNGTPLEGAIITYLNDSIPITRDSGLIGSPANRLVINFYPEFERISEGDLVYITDDVKGLFDGEFRVVTQTYSVGLYLDSNLQKSYELANNPVIMLVQQQTSDSNGNVPQVILNYAYYPDDSSILTSYGPTTKLVNYGSTNQIFKVIPSFQARDIIIIDLEDEGEEITENVKTIQELIDGLPEVDQNTQLIDDLNKVLDIITGEREGNIESLILDIEKQIRKAIEDNLGNDTGLNNTVIAKLSIIKDLLNNGYSNDLDSSDNGSNNASGGGSKSIEARLDDIKIQISLGRQDLSEYNNKIDELKFKIIDTNTGLGKRIDDLISQIGVDDYNTVLSAIIENRRYVQDLSKEVRESHDGILRNVKGIGSDLTEIKEMIHNLHSEYNCEYPGIGEIEEKMIEVITNANIGSGNSNPETLTDISTKIDNMYLDLETYTSTLVEDIDDLSTEIINNADTQMINMNTQFADLSADIDALNSNDEIINNGINELKEYFSEISEENAGLQNDVDSIKALLIELSTRESGGGDDDEVLEEINNNIVELQEQAHSNLEKISTEMSDALEALLAKLDILAAGQTDILNAISNIRIKYNSWKNIVRTLKTYMRNVVIKKMNKINKRFFRRVQENQFFRLKKLISKRINRVLRKINFKPVMRGINDIKSLIKEFGIQNEKDTVLVLNELSNIQNTIKNELSSQFSTLNANDLEIINAVNGLVSINLEISEKLLVLQDTINNSINGLSTKLSEMIANIDTSLKIKIQELYNLWNGNEDNTNEELFNKLNEKMNAINNELNIIYEQNEQLSLKLDDIDDKILEISSDNDNNGNNNGGRDDNLHGLLNTLISKVFGGRNGLKNFKEYLYESIEKSLIKLGEQIYIGFAKNKFYEIEKIVRIILSNQTKKSHFDLRIGEIEELLNSIRNSVGSTAASISEINNDINEVLGVHNNMNIIDFNELLLERDSIQAKLDELSSSEPLEQVKINIIKNDFNRVRKYLNAIDGMHITLKDLVLDFDTSENADADDEEAKVEATEKLSDDILLKLDNINDYLKNVMKNKVDALHGNTSDSGLATKLVKLLGRMNSAVGSIDVFRNRRNVNFKYAIGKLREKYFSRSGRDKIFKLNKLLKVVVGKNDDLRKLIETQIAINAFNYGVTPYTVEFPDTNREIGSNNLAGDVGTGYTSLDTSVIINIDTQTIIVGVNLNGNNEYTYYSEVYTDYKEAREEIQVAYNNRGGWDNLNDTEKEICSRWFVVDKDLRDQIHTQPEQLVNGAFHHRMMIEAKNKRISMVMSLSYNTFKENSAELNSFINRVQQQPFVESMTPLQGTVEEYITGALDVLKNGRF